jgi:hypothetical protein
MRKAAAVFLALTIIFALALPASAAQDGPEEIIENFMSEHGLTEDNFVCGWYDIQTGDSFYVGEDVFRVAGSMYKLPLAMTIYDMIAEGTLTKDDYAGGYRVGDALRLAIVYSDNDAAQALRTRVSSNRDEYRLRLAAYSGYEPDELPKEYFTENQLSPRFLINTLLYLYEHSDDYAELIDFMLDAHPGMYFKLAETDDMPIAHKYGYFEGNLGDCGIIYAERPFLLTAMFKGVAGSEKLLGELCALMADYASEPRAELPVEPLAALPLLAGAALFLVAPREALLLVLAATLGGGSPAPEAEAGPESWTLTFAGDCTIGTLDKWQGSATRNNMLYVIGDDYAYPFSGVAELFENDDFTMVNLEGTFTDETAHRGKPYCFRASPEYAECLTLGSVEAVSLANNHSRDYFENGLADTRLALDAEGVLYADEDAPLVVELRDGLTLGVAAFNAVERDGVYAVGDVDGYMRAISDDYAALDAAGCDIKLMFVHWGWEYRTEPELWMTELAQRMAELGFDAIIGSHPHVLQKIEDVDGVPVFYSLGNFAYGGHSSPDDLDSVVLRLTVERGEDGGYAVAGYEVVPCSISSTPGINDFRPQPYTDEADIERVLEKLS